MKILICSDSFKETLEATKVGEAIEKGLRKNKRWPKEKEITNMPLSDGGEGFLKTIQMIIKRTQKTQKIDIYEHTVTGPLPEQQVKAQYGVLNETTAIVEMAQAAGIEYLRKEQRNPMKTTTYGVGELLKHIEETHKNVKHVIMGVGSSATNDGGVGALQAMGMDIHMKQHHPNKKITGEHLIQLLKKPTTNNFTKLTFDIACDVDTVFIGEKGATAIYGPQKGGTVTDLATLEKGMCHLAKIFNIQTNQKGSGAAGGIAGTFQTILGANLKKGIHLIAEMVNLDDAIQQNDIIFTGEGCYDASTSEGKLVSYIQQRCQAYSKPLYIICGKQEQTAENVFALRDAFDERDCFQQTSHVLETLCSTIPFQINVETYLQKVESSA